VKATKVKVTRKNMTQSNTTPFHLHYSFATVVSRDISASQHHLPFLDIIISTKHQHHHHPPT
jgi:hypothetical protein